ncbi:hypothetical protein E5161_14090 [Cohnella pontilimi]|uniref:Uncharacterized protein n=1 Tax=Cohnella pontilimi TaxID=2564100 RepID=A0A4U0F9Y2_9BACL|nr:hypothetical protein [Cohnella pontilimi]TJY41525.1 hypothetical protein E5161_14090 [Cohnella pontilimi]
MTPKKPNKNDQGDSFLFRVEILVNSQTSGSALEQLVRILKNGGFEDYRIGSGIGQGRTIEEAIEREKKKRAAAATAASEPVSKKAAASSDTSTLEGKLRTYIDSKKLVRLNANKGRGVKVSIPCRILSFDAGKQLITAYHVDEKQVYSFKANEIEDVIE